MTLALAVKMKRRLDYGHLSDTEQTMLMQHYERVKIACALTDQLIGNAMRKPIYVMTRPVLLLPSPAVIPDRPAKVAMMRALEGALIHRVYQIFDESSTSLKLGPAEFPEEATWVLRNDIVQKSRRNAIIEIAVPEEVYMRVGMYP